jgi:hypothetical protein
MNKDRRADIYAQTNESVLVINMPQLAIIQQGSREGETGIVGQTKPSNT